MSAQVVYCGVRHGHIETGEICEHEIDEFVDSCRNAGWKSVAVAKDCKIVARWRRG